MGTDIDTIFKMLSWNSSEKEQLRGIDEAKKIEYLSVLFQPIEDKSVWENCAKVISSKSDNELKKYMNNMFEWIKDMNWPGAFDIYARIKRMNVDCIMEFCIIQKNGDIKDMGRRICVIIQLNGMI